MIWTSIRVPVDLRDALEEYRSELVRQQQRQPNRYPDWLVTQQGISLSSAIEYLLLQQRKHSERSRKNARERLNNTVYTLAETSDQNAEGTASRNAEWEEESLRLASPHDAFPDQQQGPHV